MTLLQLWNVVFVVCMAAGIFGYDQTQQLLAHAHPKLSETRVAYLNAGCIVFAAAGAAALVTGIAWLLQP